MSNELEERIKKILAENEDLRNRAEAARAATKKESEVRKITDADGKEQKQFTVEKILDTDPEMIKFKAELKDRQLIKEYKKQQQAAKVARAKASLPMKKDPFRTFDYTPKKVIDLTKPTDDRSTARKVGSAVVGGVASGAGAVASGVGTVASGISSGLSAGVSWLVGSKDAETAALEKKRKADDKRDKEKAEQRALEQKLAKTKADGEARRKVEAELKAQRERTRKAEQDAKASADAAAEETRKKEQKKREVALAAAEEQRKQEELTRKAAADAERKRIADEAERKKMLDEQAELAKKAAAAKSAPVPPDVQQTANLIVDLYGKNSDIANNAWMGVDYPLRRLLDNYTATNSDPKKPIKEPPTNDMEAAIRVANAVNPATKTHAKGGLNADDIFVFLYGYKGNTGFYMGAIMQNDGTPFTNDSYLKEADTSSNAVREKLRLLVIDARAGRTNRALASAAPAPAVTPKKKKAAPVVPPAPKKAPAPASGGSDFGSRYDDIMANKSGTEQYNALLKLHRDMQLKGKKRKDLVIKRIKKKLGKALMDSGIDLDYSLSLSCHRDKKKKEVMLTGYDSEGDELIKPTALICPTLGLADRKKLELIV